VLATSSGTDRAKRDSSLRFAPFGMTIPKDARL